MAETNTYSNYAKYVKTKLQIWNGGYSWVIVRNMNWFFLQPVMNDDGFYRIL